MASSTLHFSFGMLIATLYSLPALWRAWRHRGPASRTLLRWSLASGALGLYAVIPAIARRLTARPDLGSSAWWNIFLFYPLFDYLPIPSILIGELVAGTIFAGQYIVILFFLKRAQHK